MTSLRDQFSAVRKAQFDAQFDFFNSLTSQALESAGRVAALNMAVSRDAVQRSLGASFALMNARDPRDVLKLGSQAEEQFRSLFAYGRELLGIASGVRPYAVRPQLLSQASQQAVETVEVIERGVADSAAAATEALQPVAAPAAEAAHAVSAIAPVTEPVVVADPAPAPAPEPEALAAVAEPVPVAEPKAIVKAVGKGATRAAAAAHPAAAPVEAAGDDVAVPKVEAPPASSRRKK